MKPSFLAVLIVCFYFSISAYGQSVQIANPGFEQGGVTGWSAYVAPDHGQLQLSNDSRTGQKSCKVKNRIAFWAGIQQDLTNLVEVDADYEIRFWVKSATNRSFTIKSEVRQLDDRGISFVEIGKVAINPDTWTEFRGGLSVQSNGPLQSISLAIGATPGFQDDFLVDDVSVVANDWENQANERIEQLRKTDVELELLDENGAALSNLSINAQQIRSEFAFGSTLNAASLSNNQYSDFFKENFEWATVEWHTQWVPTEVTIDHEVYSVADESVAFARDNGITIRGHAITWADPGFVPTWLNSLSNVELREELDERILNATSHFKGKLAAWDVCNELLHHRYFRNRLGDDITRQIFNQASGSDPDTPLFTNEYDILPYADTVRTDQYVGLLNNLLAAGAKIDGIGIQSHFWTDNVSPTNLEIAFDKLSAFGLPILLTECDFLNENAAEKAKQLETVFRYAYSRPEISGVILWGFWANAHWRGQDAALVESDWTINEAGQKYLELRDEWSTNVDLVSDSDGRSAFRGFQGTYLVSVANPDTQAVSYHVVHVPKSQSGFQQATLTIPEEDNVLCIYSSPNTETITVDLNNLSVISIDDNLIPLAELPDVQAIQVVGDSGSEELIIKTSASNNSSNYFLRTNRFSGGTGGVEVRYSGVPNVIVRNTTGVDKIRIFDSPGDDQYVSRSDFSVMTTPAVTLRAESFAVTVGDAGAGNDSATLHDNYGENDLLFCDLTFMRVKKGTNNRRATKFETNVIHSDSGNDRLTVKSRIGNSTYDVTPTVTTIGNGNKTFTFNNLPYIRVNGAEGSNEVLNISDSPGDERLIIRENYTRFEDLSTFLFVAYDFSNVTALASNSGNDIASIRDTDGDEMLAADGNMAMMFGNNSHYSVTGFDSVYAVGNQGGLNQAFVDTPAFELMFFGSWDFVD